MAGKSSALLINVGVTAWKFGWMRYGPTDGRYRPRQDLVSEVVINVFVEMLYVVIGVRWCVLYVYVRFLLFFFLCMMSIESWNGLGPRSARKPGGPFNGRTST